MDNLSKTWSFKKNQMVSIEQLFAWDKKGLPAGVNCHTREKSLEKEIIGKN